MTEAISLLDDALRLHARRSPDAPAISMLGRETTYAALDAQVTKISFALIEKGVNPGDRVAVCAAKSVDSIAAVYGVLRAGCVYVPIDPAAPIDRVAAQLSATSATLALVDTARCGKFQQVLSEAQVLEIGACFVGEPKCALPFAQPERRAENTAYIFMTSGTTGTPKGIVHTHRSGLAYAKMAADLCGLQTSDRVSHHTPAHFDMSIFDIFSTAFAGACVVIIPEMHSKLPASLSELTESEKISVWYSVPHALIQLVERGVLASRNLSSLRVVMFAGEKMPPSAIKEFSKHAPNAAFLNAYGPTETNHCTTAKLTHADLDGKSPLPIGTPDAGVTARIGVGLKEAETGELLIASSQVMAGYWRDTDLTEAAFCNLKDAEGRLRRFYRTGDIVRRSKEGDLVLVGRKDRQIKLRGYRIELDEVELALVNTPWITEAFVSVSGDEIHAYVTGRSKADAREICAKIKAVLPPYAVPHHIAWLDKMPRTSTGKIDRARLTGPHHARTAA